MSSTRFFLHLPSVPILGFAAILLAGCSCLPCSQPDVPAPTVFYHMAPMAPPQPLTEDVQIPDNPRNVLWRPGYWSYDNGSFDWVSGELMSRPSPTAVWSPDHWIEHTYGWAFIPGFWQ